jgi:hypothetical protein
MATRDPRVTNRHGLLAGRAKAGKQTIKRLIRMYSQRAAAEAAFSRELVKIADGADDVELSSHDPEEGSAPEHVLDAQGVTSDAEAIASVRDIRESFRREATIRGEYAEFLSLEVVHPLEALLTSLRASKAEIEVSKAWPSRTGGSPALCRSAKLKRME